MTFYAVQDADNDKIIDLVTSFHRQPRARHFGLSIAR
jgi:hypothetical protein